MIWYEEGSRWKTALKGEILVVLIEVILEGFDPRVDLNLWD